MNHNPPYITGMGDAAMMAFELAESFRQAHTAAVLDRKGRVLDMTVFTRLDHTHRTALDWAGCAVLNRARAEAIVLFSIGPEPVDELREDDVREFEHMRRVFGQRDVRIIDWIRCDGEKMRSIGLSTGADTFPDAESWAEAALGSGPCDD